MKISLVTQSDGASRARATAALAGLGHQVTVFSDDPHADVLRKAWTRDRPDVVHAHGWLAGLAAQLAAKPLEIAVVQSFDGLTTPTQSRERAGVEKLLAKGAACVIAACTQEVDSVIRIGANRARVVTVPYGISAAPAANARSQARPLKVVSTGSLSAFAMPDVEFVVAERHTESDVASGEFWRTADVAVLPDSVAASGTATLSAMACGVPVVAAAVGANLDIVVDGVTGRLVPPSDHRSWVHELKTLLQQPFLRSSWGSAGRDRAQSRYDWSLIAAETLRVYERVVQPAARLTA